jgi:hypothetical protein
MALLSLGLFVLAGCGGAPPPAAAEEEAKQALDRALTAWQKGEPAESLKGASPSLVVADHKWGRGDKLVKYEVVGQGRARGVVRTFRVKLWLTDAKGKATQDVAECKVGTSPNYSVARSVFR